eukprot:PITA_03759
MSFNRLRLEYALEGSSNYIAWKDKMEVVLDDNVLKDFIDAKVPKPTDFAQVEAWKNKRAKCQRILLEGVKDTIVSSLHGKASPYLMWKALIDLFQRKSDQRKLVLKDKLKNIKCEKGDSIPKYLTKFTQCQDELGSVVVTVDDEDLVSLALLGLPKSWHSYQDSINGDRDLFSDLDEKDLGVHIEMADDGRYSATGIVTLSFERESGKPFILKEVMHVPVLKKNLIFVAMLEDKGYDVVFNEGKAFMRSKTTRETQKIGVRVKNLYQLHVDGCAAVACKAKGVVSRDDGELWHRRLGHLHHGALKILQQISTGLPKGTLAQLDQCKGCTLGKFVKATFHEKDSRAMMILERIRTDVCGPFLVALTAKHKYYVIFVDDFSQKYWIFFM